MKLLLFGKNGQVGWELQRSLAPLGELIALGRDDVDLTDDNGLRQLIRRVSPDVIVNAAAYTAVDKAEEAQEEARVVNAIAPSIMAQEAGSIGAWMVHYSTDYVFNGSGVQYWLESDQPDPLNVYGRTKLEGEHAVGLCPKHLIFRTSWVYASRGRNFAKTILKLAAEREQLSVIDDQFGAPTGAELIADVTAHILRFSGLSQSLSGTYHLCAGGCASWHDFAVRVIEVALSTGVSLMVAPDAVKPIPSSAYPLPAKRPSNSRLDTSKLRETFALSLPAWEIGVNRMLEEILND